MVREPLAYEYSSYRHYMTDGSRQEGKIVIDTSLTLLPTLSISREGTI